MFSLLELTERQLIVPDGCKQENIHRRWRSVQWPRYKNSPPNTNTEVPLENCQFNVEPVLKEKSNQTDKSMMKIFGRWFKNDLLQLLTCMFELKGNYWDICLDCLKYKIMNIMKLIISESSGSFFCQSIIQTPEPAGTKEGGLHFRTNSIHQSSS